jgi:hypothetical protein
MRVISGVIIVAAMGVTGCATTAIDTINQGLSKAMGAPVTQLESALGDAAEVTEEGTNTRYRWFAESYIEPCNVEVVADQDGIVRKTAWSGYQGACEPFAAGLNRVFPTTN